VAGCIYGNGAPVNKAVGAVFELPIPAPPADPHFADVQLFISGGYEMGEQLGY
jgi:hypothetical protein